MGDKKKILIIDGDQVYAEQAKKALIEAGFIVEFVDTAKEGYVTLEFFQPDLVLLEVMLEDHDAGFRLTRKIRRHPILGKTPIFILTAVAEKTGGSFSLQEDQYWMQADDFAEKPLADEELTTRVQALLSRAPLSDQQG